MAQPAPESVARPVSSRCRRFFPVARIFPPRQRSSRCSACTAKKPAAFQINFISAPSLPEEARNRKPDSHRKMTNELPIRSRTEPYPLLLLPIRCKEGFEETPLLQKVAKIIDAALCRPCVMKAVAASQQATNIFTLQGEMRKMKVDLALDGLNHEHESQFPPSRFHSCQGVLHQGHEECEEQHPCPRGVSLSRFRAGH